jgi:endonuclease G, mitochondrial
LVYLERLRHLWLTGSSKGETVPKFKQTLLIFIWFTTTGWGQSLLEIPVSPFNDEIIRHSAYTLGYSETHEQARWVAYQLTSSEVAGNSRRKDNFRQDPSVSTGSAKLSDYRGSGYDRGHLAPAADMKLNSTYMSESFFMSNMSPQNPSFNRGIWKNLEETVRKMAVLSGAVYVVTGPIFSASKGQLGGSKVTIPSSYYKVILDFREPGLKAIGFILPNTASSNPLSSFALSVDDVESRTGLDFFAGLPDDIENQLESEYDYSGWKVNDLTSSRRAGKTCAGITKAGNGCMRAVKSEDTYCYQHKPTGSTVTTKKSTSTSSNDRCQARTKKGSQCKRNAQAGSIYCWQHN